MISADNEPFSIVHLVGFKRLMSSEPRYSLPRVANVKINLRISNNLYHAHEELTDA